MLTDFSVTIKFAPLLIFLQSKVFLKKSNNLLNVKRSFCPTLKNTLNLKRSLPSLVRTVISILAKVSVCLLDMLLILYMFVSLDGEFKSVREKNRQNETVHERLSSDKVSNNNNKKKTVVIKFWYWLLNFSYPYWECVGYTIQGSISKLPFAIL